MCLPWLLFEHFMLFLLLPDGLLSGLCQNVISHMSLNLVTESCFEHIYHTHTHIYLYIYIFSKKTPPTEHNCFLEECGSLVKKKQQTFSSVGVGGVEPHSSLCREPVAVPSPE